MDKPDFIMELPELEPIQKQLSIATPELRRVEPVPRPIDKSVAVELPKMVQHTEIIYDHLPSEALQWIKPQQKKKGHFALLSEDENALNTILQKEAGVTAEYSKEIKTKDRKSVPDVTLLKDNKIVCKVHFKLYNKKDEFNQGRWYVWLFFYDFSNRPQMEQIKKCMISFFKGHDLQRALPQAYPKALNKRHSTKNHNQRKNQRKKLMRKPNITRRQLHDA